MLAKHHELIRYLELASMVRSGTMPAVLGSILRVECAGGEDSSVDGGFPEWRSILNLVEVANRAAKG